MLAARPKCWNASCRRPFPRTGSERLPAMPDGLPDNSPLKYFKGPGQSCLRRTTSLTEMRPRYGPTAWLDSRRPGSSPTDNGKREVLELRKHRWTAITIALCLAACAKSFDMSDERLAPLGPEWGIVIGSVLVKPIKLADEDVNSGEAADSTYEFHIVHTPPGKPTGDDPNAERYRLQAR